MSSCHARSIPKACTSWPAIWCGSDQHTSALELLERIVKEGFFSYQILQRDPWLDPIRGERRFNAIVARARERSQDAEAEFHRLGGDQLLGSQ